MSKVKIDAIKCDIDFCDVVSCGAVEMHVCEVCGGDYCFKHGFVPDGSKLLRIKVCQNCQPYFQEALKSGLVRSVLVQKANEVRDRALDLFSERK
jgi:hypothetical protein